MLDNFGSVFSVLGADTLLWAVGLTVAVIVLILLTLLGKAYFGSRVRNRSNESGMGFGDLDAMQKHGLLSKEEYKQVRRKLAERSLSESQKAEQAARDRQLLQLVELDPEAARELLPPGVRERATPTDQPAAPPQPAGPAPSPAPPAAVDEALAGDPLAMMTPPPPSMNMPRVVRERNHADEGNPSELDLLFQKGAIGREEYERLKGFFKKSE